mmetsp:Transcript_118932/g.237031  ORF Transcript_118932/g.237031 Transcript_118932/m.237031 type:complete len:488 (+) Transcript_118932:68-1531(+)
MAGGGTHEAVADLHKALLSEQHLPSSRSHPELGARGGEGGFLKAPGGFRRYFLHRKASEEGKALEQRPVAWSTPFLESVRPLIRVGYFESVLGIRLSEDGETLPPLPGESGIPQTILALSKSFVGSGITFLPGAFSQGGWLFSSVVLGVIAIVNAICIRQLLDCSKKTGRSGYGDIGELAAGAIGKQAVHVSLVVSQFGAYVAFLIFISQMAESLGALDYVSKSQVIMILVAILVPLCWIRNIHKMEFAILGADVLIIFGLGAILSYSVQDLRDHGPDPNIVTFKPQTCGLFLGTAVYTFEGIPYILPIADSMRQPEKFWPLFLVVFPCIAALFIVFGLVGYVNYGAGVKTVVLLNMPTGDILSASVRAAYMAALLLSLPLVFLSAARITELWIFGVIREKGSKKWSKNALRTAEVCLFGVVAIYGAEFFEKFLAFVGATCCAPIAFIYPSYFHLRLCAEGLCAKLFDAFFILLGLTAMGFVLYATM